MTIPRRHVLQLVAAAALLPSARTARADDYPSRPITVIVPFSVGGPLDITGRMIAAKMQQTLGQPLIIENVGGAGGSIGVGRGARAVPDGYTLTMGIWSTHVVNPVLYDLSYDVEKDFEPIAILAVTLAYVALSVPIYGAADALPIAVFAGFLFLITLYLQDVRGYSALHAGLYTLPMAAMTVVFAPLSGRIAGARGCRSSWRALPSRQARSC